jgi:pyrimidine operon attenuation protein / uracil phosphoribosyltransferase
MPDTPTPCLLDARQVEVHLQRLCREIVAAFGNNESLALVGIRSRGLHLAERLRPMVQEILQKEIPLGILDITLYRDDLSELTGSPIVRPTEIPFTLKERTVVLVDDVIFTGRTIRAAMDALLDHGRPNRIWLAVLADRGGRQLPIQPDFMGLKLDVPLTHRVSVKVREMDGVDGVYLEKRT